MKAKTEEIHQMKRGKATVVVVLALALSLGLAAASWAQPGMGCGMGMGMGRGMANLTPDQAGKLFDLKKKFQDDTAGLRKQMMVKHAELGALWRAENPDQKAIEAKQKEVNDLKGQIQQKMVAFRLEARKIAPNAGMGMGRGFGHGKGMGMGMGPGGGCGAGPGGVCPVPPPPPAK
jgi:zinc resistance-associated protein